MDDGLTKGFPVKLLLIGSLVSEALALGFSLDGGGIGVEDKLGLFVAMRKAGIDVNRSSV